MPDEYEFLEDELQNDPHAWRDYAMCLDATPEDDRIIFPWGATPPEPEETQQWIEWNCDICPVRQRCLDFALDTESEGIWGGVELGIPELRSLRRLREDQGSITVDEAKTNLGRS